MLKIFLVRTLYSGGQFFHKEPHSGSIVPWHQDAQYWPLKPANAVTVWLAVYDTDIENGAMKVVSGSHKKGAGGFSHHTNELKRLCVRSRSIFRSN